MRARARERLPAAGAQWSIRRWQILAAFGRTGQTNNQEPSQVTRSFLQQHDGSGRRGHASNEG